MKTNKIQILIVTLFLMLSVGCSNLQKSYVEADIKTYRAVAPDLVEKYNKINNPIEKKLKLGTVKTWGDRLEEALKHEDMSESRAKFVRVKIPE